MIRKIKYLLVTGFLACSSLSALATTSTGIASYYAHYHHGKTMANGAKFNMYANTVAHKTLPLGTKLLVQNLKNGKKIQVTVTDRGPYIKGRVLDLSLGVAQKLDMIDSGTAKVKYTILHKPEKNVYAKR